MTEQITAQQDPVLGARILRRTPLYYEEGADPDTERPAFVRAGSSLAPVGDATAVIGDDARFVALLPSDGNKAASIPLPADSQGHRVSDDAHHNKGQKLDLEACVTIPMDGGERLLAMGSGSGPERETLVLLTWTGGAAPEIAVHDLPALYATLREDHAFSGSGLNVEGVVYLQPDTLRLFQRGNGTPRDGLRPVNATGDLRWSELWAYLADPDTAPPPRLSNIVEYDLGTLDGVRLTFSDAEILGESIVYSASAEEQGGDGRVAGSVLGVIDHAGARWAKLTDQDGSAFQGKIEGLSFVHGNPQLVRFVVDEDNTETPSDLYEAELTGPWDG